MQDKVRAILRKTISVHEALIGQCDAIADVADRLARVFKAGGTVYVMGNGGSAADGQHLAGEMVGRFLMERPPLPCHSFSTDTSILTAVGNDYGFDQVFVKQVQAFVQEGDAVIGISTSGNAANVVGAVAEAKERGAFTIGLTGGDGGALARACGLALVVPADETPRIQEAHGTIIHIICDLVEQALFGT